jgi:hypothetical protein
MVINSFRADFQAQDPLVNQIRVLFSGEREGEVPAGLPRLHSRAARLGQLLPRVAAARGMHSVNSEKRRKE